MKRTILALFWACAISGAHGGAVDADAAQPVWLHVARHPVYNWAGAEGERFRFYCDETQTEASNETSRIETIYDYTITAVATTDNLWRLGFDVAIAMTGKVQRTGVKANDWAVHQSTRFDMVMDATGRIARVSRPIQPANASQDAVELANHVMTTFAQVFCVHVPSGASGYYWLEEGFDANDERQDIRGLDEIAKPNGAHSKKNEGGFVWCVMQENEQKSVFVGRKVSALDLSATGHGMVDYCTMEMSLYYDRVAGAITGGEAHKLEYAGNRVSKMTGKISHYRKNGELYVCAW